MRLALAPALALALVALTPLASADHVFSHRVYVAGRVVDVDGLPWAGAPVVVSFAGVAGEPSRCVDFLNRPELTGERGDFVVCRHAHALPANLTVTVRVAGVNATKPIDTALRHAFFAIQADGKRTARDVEGDRAFHATLRVDVRVFKLLPAPIKVEGVEVPAVPRDGENVSVELRSTPEGEILARANATVDAVGDAMVEFRLAAIPEGALVVAEANGTQQTAAASTLFRRADLYVVTEDIRPVGERPGAQTPLPAWFALAAFSLALALRRKRS